MGKSIDSLVSGSNNDTAQWKELQKSITTMMKERYKGDPARADKEAEELIKRLAKNQEAQMKAMGKTEAEIRKEKIKAAQREAQIKLAAA